jgi:MFS family permease
LGSVLASGINVLATALAVHLMDRSGRRRLLLSSSIGMCFATAILTVALFLAQASPASILLGYVSVGAVLLFVIFFEIGLGPIPWLITAEIFPPEVSATAMTATSTVNWVNRESHFIPIRNRLLLC